MSPRCMIKVDLEKAYNSIELGFPKQFIQWITACDISVSFSVLINGKLSC